MKAILVLVLALVVCAANAPAQTETQPGVVEVEEITLARDDGNGKPGEQVENFSTADRPIHFRILLNSTKAAAVKMNLVVVSANGLKAGTNVVTVNYKTNGEQNRVRFNATPEEKFWSAGKYRVDILLNGKLSKSLEFEIQKNQSEAVPETSPEAAKKPRPNRKN